MSRGRAVALIVLLLALCVLAGMMCGAVISLGVAFGSQHGI